MLLQYACGGTVIPFITLVMRDRGADFAQISWLLTFSASTMLVFPFFWGMLADRFIPLNRLFTVLNLVASGALLMLILQRKFAGSLLSFSLFYACLNPAFTLLTALSFHHLPNPREQFGILRAWGSLGWILPFLPISLWMIHRGTGDLSFIPVLGAAVCLAMVAWSFALPHTPPGAVRKDKGSSAGGHYLPALKKLLGNPNYRVLVLGYFLISGSFSLLTYYSPPFLESLGIARPWLGPIQAIGVIVEIILFQWHPALLRRWNFARVMFAGCVALAVRHALFCWLSNVWILAFSFVLAGVVVVCFHITASVLVNVIAGKAVRATAQSFLFLVGTGLGPMFSNWAAGRVAAAYGNSLRPVFALASILAWAAAILIASWRHHLNRAGKHEAHAPVKG